MSKCTSAVKWEPKRERWYTTAQKDGQRKFFYSSLPGRKGQAEVKAKADAWLETGVNPSGERIEKLYADWYATLEQTTGTGNCRNVESRWRTRILPAIGKKRITSLTEQDLQNVVNKAFADDLSKKTLQSLCADMRSFCKYCRARKLTTFNPEGLRVPAGARLKGKTILQPDALQTLFSVSSTLYRGKRVQDDFIGAYRFAVLTGLRPGELLGLRWADVQGETVTIRRAVNVLGEETQGKNENALRSFALSGFARSVLEQQRAVTSAGGSVFDIVSEGYFYKRWQVYCKANDLPPVSLYSLRHTFVSIVKNLPAGDVKALVGHSKSMDTLGVYAHALNGDAENTARAVDAEFIKLLGNA